jgi:hypothetical protein
MIEEFHELNGFMELPSGWGAATRGHLRPPHPIARRSPADRKEFLMTETMHDLASTARTVTITLDNEPLPDVPRDTTPNAILNLAGIDSTSHYLVRIEGRHQESYAGRGDTEITVHENEVFVSVSTGPTPTA